MPKDKEVKICIYCNRGFDRSDFPKSFDRMITCGSVACIGKRRRELFNKRLEVREIKRFLAPPKSNDLEVRTMCGDGKCGGCCERR